MIKDQELTVITKTYDLILWSCNHTSRFPRNHRFVLGEESDEQPGETGQRYEDDAPETRVLLARSFNQQRRTAWSAEKP
jgi:hypothetical protein